MKKQLLKKTLLLATGLLVGASAWADAGDVTTNVNLTFAGSATFTANKSYTYTKGEGEVLSSATGTVWNDGGSTKSIGLAINDDGQLRMSNGNMAVVFDGDAARPKDIVTIEFDLAYLYVYNSSTDRELQFNVYAGDNIVVKESFNFNKSTISASTMGLTTDYIKYAGSTTDWANKVHFVLTFNYDTQKISMTTACSTATRTTGNFEIDMPENTSAITKFYISCGSANAAAGRYALFDNLTVKTTEGDYSTTATITYAYKDDSDNDITELALSNGGLSSATPDKNSTYTPTYPSSFVDGDYAYDYTYTSGGEAFTVTGDATITLVYTKSAHATTDVTVQYKYGDNVVKEAVVAEAYPVGKPLTYYVNQYVLDGSTFYATDGSSYWVRTTPATATLTEALSLSGIANVAFFTEAEDVEGTSKGTTQAARASNGQTGYTGSTSTFKDVTNLASGKYKIYVKGMNGNTGNKNAAFKVGEDVVFNFAITQGTNQQGSSDEFIVAETSTLYFASEGGNNSGGSQGGVDWFYVVKTGDAVVPATITSSTGYATFSSAYALDFTDIEDVTAWVATTIGEEAVTMEQVTGTVKAGTGLVIKGATTNIPVVADGTDYSTTNKLVAVTEGSVTPESGYVLSVQDGKAVFAPIASVKPTVTAGHAYLSTGAGARTLRIAFGSDDTTGITAVENTAKSDATYNLNGQRIAQPTKGLYIVGGKKVIVK